MHGCCRVQKIREWQLESSNNSDFVYRMIFTYYSHNLLILVPECYYVIEGHITLGFVAYSWYCILVSTK